MRHTFLLLLSAALAVSTIGCGDFLSGPGVDEDPNNITNLTRPGPLYIGIQALQSVQFEGQLARNAAEYVQQIAGHSRQQIGYDLYGLGPSDSIRTSTRCTAPRSPFRAGEGCSTSTRCSSWLRAVNDSIYIGIGKVYEALVIGMAASIWGDIPYREAADSTNQTPAFDPQLQVYSDVLAQLDSAIFFLAAAQGPPNAGPPADNAELVDTRRGRRCGRAGSGVHPGGTLPQGPVPHAPGRSGSQPTMPWPWPRCRWASAPPPMT